MTSSLVCLQCKLTFPQKRALNTHIKTVHNQTSKKCPNCALSFKHTSSLRRHVKTTHSKTVNSKENTNVSSTTDDLGTNTKQTLETISNTQIKRPRCDKKMYPAHTHTGKKLRCDVPSGADCSRIVGLVYDQFQQLCERLCTAEPDSFLAWSQRYQDSRGSDDASLSLSTATNVVSTYTNHFENLKLKWSEPLCFCEHVDDWLDVRFADKALQPITTVNHLRHLKWWGMYMYTHGHTSGIVLEWLTDNIASLQANASKRTNDAPCIAMLDPYQLATLRDRIVMALQKQQRDVIDPFLHRICRDGVGTITQAVRKECIDFGILHLRCFLDLVMRFLCPPQRMQCTIYQCEPDSVAELFVCKLSHRQNGYVRIIYRDKSGNTRQPVEVPVGSTISCYLTFYRQCCRPNPTRSHTFQSKGGGYWIHASRDVKDYVRDHLGIDPAKIEPNGRFVHGSRHIGLATYALAVQFNSERLREFAHLIRHSVAVSEKYYSVWLERNRNERATKHFVASMGVEKGTEFVEASTYRPLTLRLPDVLVRTCMMRSFQEELGKTTLVESPFGLRDASTQTGVEHHCENLQPPLSDSCTLPLCTLCQRPFLVFGPLGQTRHSKFGHYFAQCLNCDGRRPCGNTVWYSKGYVPDTPSMSQKPRNRDKIKAHNMNKK